MPSFFLLFLETDVLYCVIAPRELYPVTDDSRTPKL